MQIKYAVSLWNYYHYANVPSLERILALLREQGYGVEIWAEWQEEKNLFDEICRKRLKQALDGMPVSLHTTTVANTLELHKKQIDTAAYVGADVVVIHPSDIPAKGGSGLDVALAREAVDYASDQGVKIALENVFGPLSDLVDAVEKTEGLGICLDVGHVSFTEDPMRAYLDALQERIIHLHIQDILPETEAHLPGAWRDHYIPGTGGISEQDWRLVIASLKAIDFRGTAVFEIHPRGPLHTALLAKTFLEGLVAEDVT